MDQPALEAACRRADRGVVGVFVCCPEQWREHDWGDAKADFVMRCAAELSASLKALNVPLLFRVTPRFDGVPDLLAELASRYRCDGLFFNRELEVNEKRRDDAVTRRFESLGLPVYAFHDQTVLAPGEVMTKEGGWYTVFTPFKKRWLAVLEERGQPDVCSPRRVAELACEPEKPMSLAPGYQAWGGAALWPAGEAEAQRRLKAFVGPRLYDYRRDRDLPGLDGTSTLSPYLSAGAVSVRDCLRAAMNANAGLAQGGSEGAATWVSELVWREFYRHLLVGFPRLSKGRPFRPETQRVPWRTDPAGLEAWKQGRTGYPFVDAGMRQLLSTGWMHNRLRMVTAMFLTKDLLIDWREGERHFMHHLVDADLAQNNGGWQWSASTGTDAQPYFRIFNPVTQGERFDPRGQYIRHWVPELVERQGEQVHWPHGEGGLFGTGYPAPIVDHALARGRVLEAFGQGKGQGQGTATQ
jgi:deoxyribodipyrimidine photo-lyase